MRLSGMPLKRRAGPGICRFRKCRAYKCETAKLPSFRKLAQLICQVDRWHPAKPAGVSRRVLQELLYACFLA
jgi:hypothetical protein